MQAQVDIYEEQQQQKGSTPRVSPPLPYSLQRRKSNDDNKQNREKSKQPVWVKKKKSSEKITSMSTE